jgi:transcriptional regulator with XRE-family HTH domain
VVAVDNEPRRKELADFLRTRRLRLTPSDVGLKIDTSRRRTPGLRREEVASLSGISLPWYTALEQGRDIRVSEQVLLSLARTLQLSEDELNHVFVLANPSSSAHALAAADEPISPALQQILDRLGTYPAYVYNKRWNVIAWNSAASALLGNFNHLEEIERNILWRIFTIEENKKQIVDWKKFATALVAQFRSQYALYMNDPWYRNIVSQLSDASAEFRELWGQHDVSTSTVGKKEFLLPEVGSLAFVHSTFSISENGDFMMTVYTPVEGTETDKRMEKLLGAC